MHKALVLKVTEYADKMKMVLIDEVRKKLDLRIPGFKKK
jgi:hypothetical protein